MMRQIYLIKKRKYMIFVKEIYKNGFRKDGAFYKLNGADQETLLNLYNTGFEEYLYEFNEVIPEYASHVSFEDIEEDIQEDIEDIQEEKVEEKKKK